MTYTENEIRAMVRNAKKDVRQACKGFGKPIFKPWTIQVGGPANYGVLTVPYIDPETGLLTSHNTAI